MLSYYVNMFYFIQQKWQYRKLVRRIKFALSIIFGKEFMLYEVISNKDDIEKFANNILSITSKGEQNETI